MGRKSKILLASIVTVAIAGCASEDTPPIANPSPPPTAAPVAKAPVKAESFNNPVVSPNASVKVASGTPNLIQLTNGTERANLVSKGRIDPFAQIIGQPIAEMPANTPVKTVPSLPPLPPGTTPKRVNVKNNANSTTNKKTLIAKSRPSLMPVLPKVLPQVVPNPTLVSVLPPPAQPDLAKAVVVTGVVIVGREPQAIIKIPNEIASRYVQAGQRLANGLLVKRIEMNAGSNPIVILEQYGIEVARMVGEAPVGTIPGSTSPTGSPVSVVTPTTNLPAVGAS
ncbi:hypothetical protein ACN23B_19340 [Anabaena sp. FACHB-709]|uniref:Uncharacterized protein n=2 Tax=Nostocaceae TaxID=1162 RepID=A0A1Z4KKI2_ANAVA|nr:MULTISPECIES: hypothetical protein [Nostocaceae]BAY69477.1 hypothetical protein NIES23_22710 [Trichormus variabilis NIES-23]HBW30094.1 hypothetical protein [Nostoc sp. UBA8866]MBD2171055.1 hypothetical protein [Anabaena cylindrica FACHB-318]MBD2262835.1 hypothetical protein [Anabaena sp. FACHB-709]MBD2272367.1 hypothetical protein [Nostoc sp. PCC 7120 = FACHB-418]